MKKQNFKSIYNKFINASSVDDARNLLSLMENVAITDREIRLCEKEEVRFNTIKHLDLSEVYPCFTPDEMIEKGYASNSDWFNCFNITQKPPMGYATLLEGLYKKYDRDPSKENIEALNKIGWDHTICPNIFNIALVNEAYKARVSFIEIEDLSDK